MKVVEVKASVFVGERSAVIAAPSFTVKCWDRTEEERMKEAELATVTRDALSSVGDVVALMR